MESLSFLTSIAKAKRQPVYVLLGDEDFLVRRCREAIISRVVGDADPSFAVASYPGDKLDFSMVRNELETLPFLAPARIVIIEQADTFITANREALQKYVAAPSSINVLILEPKTFPETTLLAKALSDSAKITCKAPKDYKLLDWCIGWSTTAHQKRLSRDAAEYLLQQVGPSMGLLAQELDKLATSVGAAGEITPADVERFVPRSRSANVFLIMDAIGDGQPQAALGILSELLDDGEEPIALLGALTSQLRKLANVGRLVAQGQPLAIAMDMAGIMKWPQARQSAERQVKHLGRRRLDQLTDWLIEVNLGLKGNNPLPPRVQLEMLIVRLARPRT
jgi:DNA polymerase III subunit delta